jgi:hypothetical protein
MQFYMEKHPFSVFDFILQEVISISRTALRSCGYAPQIMIMIGRVSKIDFLKDHEMMDLKPQFLNKPVISMDVPSPSVAPRSTRSGSATPPPARSSSSSGGVLRVLKSMFAWCCDTCQRQDVLLSNQRCPSLLFPLWTSRPWRHTTMTMPIDPTVSMKKKKQTTVMTRTTMSDLLLRAHSFPFLVP